MLATAERTSDDSLEKLEISVSERAPPAINRLKYQEALILPASFLSLAVGSMVYMMHRAIGLALIGSFALLLASFFVEEIGRRQAGTSEERERTKLGFTNWAVPIYVAIGLFVVSIGLNVLTVAKTISVVAMQGHFGFYVDIAIASAFIVASVTSYTMADAFSIAFFKR
jgi:hypothetical protein